MTVTQFTQPVSQLRHVKTIYNPDKCFISDIREILFIPATDQWEMSRNSDTYSQLDTRDWSQDPRAQNNSSISNRPAPRAPPPQDEYSLKKLDYDWSNVLESKLKGT